MHIPIVRDSASILRPLFLFAEQYFFLIMNKQEYNKFNLIIRYFALLSLLVSNEDRKVMNILRQVAPN
jgi:predicted membrane protein